MIEIQLAKTIGGNFQHGLTEVKMISTGDGDIGAAKMTGEVCKRKHFLYSALGIGHYDSCTENGQ